jgi:8-oxo-dGTP pyrophosphatase MutT (NUDIX family)
MRKRSAGIIIKDDKILMIHRYKKGKEYFVLPGGGIEGNETPEQAVIREIKEETSLDITVEKSLPYFIDEIGNEHYVYICNYISGEPAFAVDSPEALRNNKDNHYSLEWIDQNKISELTIFPIKTKEQLVDILI